MKNVTISLNPATREELYADIHADFLAQILMEALFNVVQNIPTAMAMYLPVVDDAIEYAEDPDSKIMESVEYLMEMVKQEDALKGVLVDDPSYLVSLNEHQTFVTYKLCNAIEAIAQFNDMGMLMAVGDILRLPEYQAKLNFSTTHLGDRVMFMISGLIDL